MCNRILCPKCESANTRAIDATYMRFECLDCGTRGEAGDFRLAEPEPGGMGDGHGFLFWELYGEFFTVEVDSESVEA